MNRSLRHVITGAAALSIMSLLAACGDDEDSDTLENTSGVHVVDEGGQPTSPPQGVADEGASGELGAIIGHPSEPEFPADEAIPEGMQRIMFRGLRTFVPADWESQPPASSMREIQMRVPSQILDKPDAGFVVYGGITGTVQQNIDRWTAQFTGDDGMPVQAQVEDLWVGDLQIAVVELTGDYTSTMVPGESGPDMTMIQAIVETPSGEQIFVRLLGPRAVVAANRAALRAALESLASAR